MLRPLLLLLRKALSFNQCSCCMKNNLNYHNILVTESFSYHYSQCALVFYSTYYYGLKYLRSAKTTQIFPEGELKNGGLEVRLSNEFCNCQFLLGTCIACSLHKKSPTHRWLAFIHRVQWVKLQNDVLKMWNSFSHLRWDVREYRGVLRGKSW